MIKDYSILMGRPKLTILESVGSTNNYIRDMIARGDVAGDYYAVISDCQTGGRGRYGRSFYSPADSGIYLSYAFRSSLDEASLLTVTPVVASLAHKVLSRYSDSPLKIKWVNDLYNSSGKITGILTELVPSGRDMWVIVGIGINVRSVPELSPELSGIVGHLTDDKSLERGVIAGQLLDAFEETLSPDTRTLQDLRDYYRCFCMSLNREVTVKPAAGDAYSARSLDIDEAYHLVVQKADSGERITLTSGEVSVSV